MEKLDQRVRQLPIGAGVCDDELPWVAMPIRTRIGSIKNSWQKADKLFREGNQTEYEKEAGHIYGLLREAWERGLEEVLLGGIVKRYRANIQTQQIGKIADITPEDCNAVEVAMTKSSKWLTGTIKRRQRSKIFQSRVNSDRTSKRLRIGFRPFEQGETRSPLGSCHKIT